MIVKTTDRMNDRYIDKTTESIERQIVDILIKRQMDRMTDR